MLARIPSPSQYSLALLSLLVSLPFAAAAPRPGFAEILGNANLHDPAERDRLTQAIQAHQAERKREAETEATRRGLPFRRVLPNGRIMELMEMQDGQLLYNATQNASVAISHGSNILRNAPLSLLGSGVTVGLWDGGSARSTHQEFGSRVTVRDGSPAVDHATHVGGTIGASGVNVSARGMAPAVTIHSYDWNSDAAEMTSRGATAPADANRLYISNHSYGLVVGWNYVGQPTHTWEWTGAGTAAASIEDDFGRYHSQVRDIDSLAFNAPYYLIFRAAGNERLDNPSGGQSVLIGGATVPFSAATHPAGDGLYRGGFETIGFHALAKNVITVGAVSDAVAAGVRSPAVAVSSSYSSWGPTDDGRIKPDVVGNGDNVFSTLTASDTAYGTFSGTSMATPGVSGLSAQLQEYYTRLFPNQSMRAATLKALLIHTADDIGNAGPDYRYGWGLVNGQRAATLISTAQTAVDRLSIVENTISTAAPTQTHFFGWDGTSPLRVTAAWTDPAGAGTTTVDSRTTRLVNNLQLQVFAPDGTPFQPYTMPFVGTWTQASMDLPATTGVNNTDNVEQVYIAAPPTAVGTYRAVVTYSGTLTNSTQRYSILFSGTASAGPLPPNLVSISPNEASPGLVNFTLAGTSFQPGATVTFSLAGEPDELATVTNVTSTTLSGNIDLAGMTSGLWTVTVRNPDNQSGTLTASFAVLGTLYTRNFDAGTTGWTTSATTGTTNWALQTNSATAHTPSSSWFASGPVTKNTDNLQSELFTIPANASRLRFSFWHQYNLELGNDGGVLEFSINGATFFQVPNTGTQEAITTGGYTQILNNPNGPASNRNAFAGRAAWTGNSGTGFRQVVVSLTDTAKYAGKTLRARWRLGTNNSVASPGGWRIDSLTLTGVGGSTNLPPEILANVTSAPVADTGGKVLQLNLTATDDGGEPNLAYTWSHTGGTFERSVAYSENGSNTAKATQATIPMAGNYSFLVTVRDAAGATTTDTLDVSMPAMTTTAAISPETATIPFNQSLPFTAVFRDQFGDAMPATPKWELVDGLGGTINSSGLFTPASTGGPFAIRATFNGISATVPVSVTKAPATIQLLNLAQIYDGNAKPVGTTTTPTGLPVTLTYAEQPGAPSLHGSYTVVATINHPNYEGSASGILTISGIPLTNWAAEQFTATEIAAGMATEVADPDRDGLDNLAEYALGTDPTISNTAGVPHMDETGLWMQFTRPKALPNVQYLAEWSDELVDWDPAVLEVLPGPTAGTEILRIREPGSSTAQRRLLRLRFVKLTSP